MIVLDPEYYLTSPKSSVTTEQNEIQFFKPANLTDNINSNFTPTINIISSESLSTDSFSYSPSTLLDTLTSLVEFAPAFN